MFVAERICGVVMKKQQQQITHQSGCLTPNILV